MRREALLVGDSVVRGRDLEELLVCLPFTVPGGDSHGFVAISETEIITAKGVWMPKVRFVPVILEDRVEDQSVTNK